MGILPKKELRIVAVHIPGIENVEADHKSRIKPNIEWELPNEIFLQLENQFGEFDIDLFASRITHKIPQYCSWLPDPVAKQIDAFSFSWKDIKFYAFPPFSTILRTVRKIWTERGEYC